MCCGKHKMVRIGDGAPVAAPAVDSANYKIRPTEKCAFCAEKHLGTAWALSREGGYSPAVNRAAAIGELGLCQWHLWEIDLKLAQKIRNIRHLIQMRKESEVRWEEVLTEMDALASAEASNKKEA